MTIDKAIELIVSCVEAAESEYGTGESWHKEWEAVEMANDALREALSRVPEVEGDLIDRKELGAAIDAWLTIDRYYHPYSKQKTIPVSEVVDIIKQLPSAPPKHSENAMSKQHESNKLGAKTGETCTDCISRQAAIELMLAAIDDDWEPDYAKDRMCELPSAQPEPLTDKEQRIFLAAMTREEKVCKKVDAEMSREPYEDTLVRICREIERKVKGALWT